VSQFTVLLTRVATRDLDRLSSSDRDQVSRALRTLDEEPMGRPPRIKRLKGFSFPLYRLRSSDYRVLSRIDEAVVTVMRVINRSELDRTLRKFRLGQP